MKATNTRNYYEVCLIPSKITSTHILPSSYFRLGGGFGGGGGGGWGGLGGVWGVGWGGGVGGVGGGGGGGSRDFQENRGEISPN